MYKNTLPKNTEKEKPIINKPTSLPQHTYGKYSTQAAADRIDSLYLDSLARDLGYKYLGGGGR